jgi:hypothetical protein
VRSYYEALSDPEERDLLLALPAPDAYVAYAAWLGARGDERAEVVGLIARLLGELPDEERRALGLRLVAAAAELPEMWLELIATPFRTRNCGTQLHEPAEVRFAFACDQSWLAMQPTDDAKVRMCERCRTAVVRCDDLVGAERQARLGACIAVAVDVVGQATEKYCRLVTGRPDVVAMWARRLFADRKRP